MWWRRRSPRSIAGGRSARSRASSPMEPDRIVRAARALADAGVDYVKVALFPEPRREDCIRALSTLARAGEDRRRDVRRSRGRRGARPADGRAAVSPARCSIRRARRGGAPARPHERRGAGRLRRRLPPAWPDGRSRRIARGAGCAAPALAGTRRARLPRRAVRATTTGAGHIDAASVGIIRALIPVDPRAARPHATPPPRSTIACWRRAAMRSRMTSRPIASWCAISCCRSRIGAYTHEREKPQNVRFNVDVGAFAPALRRRTCATCSPTT